MEQDMSKVTAENSEITTGNVATAAAVQEAPVVESHESAPMEERVIQVGRVSRTQKGGRRMRFRALVVVGDRHGNVGMGIGKSGEIAAAVAKATYQAKKNIITVPIVRNTIPHEIRAKFDTAYILLKPASVGTSIIAGSSVRPILELAGVENVVAKCLTRTTNKVNNAYATMEALKALKDIRTIAPRKYVKAKKVAAETVAPAVVKEPVAEKPTPTSKSRGSDRSVGETKPKSVISTRKAKATPVEKSKE